MIPKPIEVELPFDDERHDLQYLLRVLFTEESGDNLPLPDVHIERLRVVEVRRLGDDGEVVSVDTGPDVRRFDARVWELIEDDPLLREGLEGECRSTPPLTDARAVESGWMRRTTHRGAAEQRGAG